MNLFENIRLALKGLTANKLRAFLTMLGIIIGVAAVITLLSVGKGVESFVVEEFESLGNNLLFVVPGQFSYDTAFHEATSHDPDIIYAPLLPIDASSFIVQKHESSASNIPTLGGRYYMSQWFIERSGDAAEGVYAVGPNVSNAMSNRLAETFTNVYGEPPTSSEAAFSYDAMRLLLEGIRKVAVVGSDDTLLIGRKALRDAVFQTADYPGITGNITCTAWGDCSAPGTIVVARVKYEKWENVFIP